MLLLQHSSSKEGSQTGHSQVGHCLNQKLELYCEPLLYSPSITLSRDVSSLLLNHFRDVTSNTFSREAISQSITLPC